VSSELTVELRERRCEIPRAQLRAVALDVANLIFAWRDWLHRRAETVAFEDDRMARRRVVVDFSFPTFPDYLFVGGSRGRAENGGLTLDERYLPIALVQKRKLGVFMVEDQAGESIPSVTRETRQCVAAEALVALAEGAVGTQGLSAVVREDLERIAVCRTGEANGVLNRFFDAKSDSGDADECLRYRLFTMAPLRDLATALTWSYILMIPYCAPFSARRQVLSFSYYESTVRDPLDNRGYPKPISIDDKVGESRAVRQGRFVSRSVSRIARALGWQPRRLWFPATAIGNASSYHFEIHSPTGLQFSNAKLKVMTGPSAMGDVAGGDDEPPKPRAANSKAALGGWSVPGEGDLESGSTALIHLYVNNPPESAWGFVYAELRPLRTALVVQAALVTSILVTALLGSMLVMLSRIDRGSADAAAALLLLGPSLFATYTVVANEHPMTTSLLAGIRLLALAAGLCSFVATAIMVLSPSGRVNVSVWRVPTVVSAVVTTCLAISWLAARKRPSRKSEDIRTDA
jgi:hypothetical protein